MLRLQAWPCIYLAIKADLLLQIDSCHPSPILPGSLCATGKTFCGFSRHRFPIHTHTLSLSDDALVRALYQYCTVHDRHAPSSTPRFPLSSTLPQTHAARASTPFGPPTLSLQLKTPHSPQRGAKSKRRGKRSKRPARFRPPPARREPARKAGCAFARSPSVRRRLSSIIDSSKPFSHFQRREFRSLATARACVGRRRRDLSRVRMNGFSLVAGGIFLLSDLCALVTSTSTCFGGRDSTRSRRKARFHGAFCVKTRVFALLLTADAKLHFKTLSILY